MSSEIGSIQPNPFIYNIENRRKRKARLAHEMGAGARCRKCEDKCPGFQLHFWRKICQNCRCGKDDHEVEDDDEDIGQIVIGKLFERPIRTKEEEQLYSYGTDLEMVNESTGKKEKLKFDWVPPGVARDLAKRYMELLPFDKRPVAGSQAAKDRRRQLEQQLPLYDMDESERCENLPPEELQNFQKYLEVLRTRVAGQASVQEIVPMLPRQMATALRSENFPPPPDSWINSDPSIDSDTSDPQNFSRNVENSLNNNMNLDPVIGDPKSAFINELLGRDGNRTRFGRNRDANVSEIAKAFGGLSVDNKYDFNPSEEAAIPMKEANLPCQQASISPYLPVQSQYALPSHPDSAPEYAVSNQGICIEPINERNLNNSKERYESPTNLNTVSQFSGMAVKHLTSPKPFIAKSEQQNIRPGQYSTSLSLKEGQPRETKDGQYPSPHKIQQYPSGHEVHIAQSEDLQPLGQQYSNEDILRNRSPVPPGAGDFIENNKTTHQGRSPLLAQYVGRDGLVPSYNAKQAPYMSQRENIPGCGGYAQGDNVHVLFPNESQQLGGMLKQTDSERSSMSQFTCQYCEKSMNSGDVAVICERAGPGKYWHPKCFVCVTCNELLADLIYFYKDGQVFCGRHYTQAADMPRCKACDELIFGNTWTRADNFNWHIHHYCCFVCDQPLAGSKYIPDEKGFPHCMSCYMSFKAKMCETCEDKITPDQTRAGYRGYYYHARPECFSCHKCRVSMIGQRFKMVKNWVFCSQDCISASEEQIAMNPNLKEKVY